MYDVGEGVPQDDCLDYTAEFLAKAQYNLGVMYALGEGVIKDYVYAHMWGNIASMNVLMTKGNIKRLCSEKISHLK